MFVMDAQLRKEFWNNFRLPVQEEDPSVSFVNPSDVHRSLIKARNWLGTLNEVLVELKDKHKGLRILRRVAENKLGSLEKKVLARSFPIPTSAVKNKIVQDAFVYSEADEAEKDTIDSINSDVETLIQEMDIINESMSELDTMRKALDRTTDWLIQYLNWLKFELRDLNR